MNNDLGFGFIYGLNKVTKSKVLYWLHTDDINWNAYLWYISQYTKIENYDKDSFVIKLYSGRQRQYFYTKTKEYSDDVGSHNYGVNKGNLLYQSHHRNYNRNKEIIERLVKEP